MILSEGKECFLVICHCTGENSVLPSKKFDSILFWIKLIKFYSHLPIRTTEIFFKKKKKIMSSFSFKTSPNINL